ncbi:MAG: hypothetical protein ACYTCN_09690 [Planctomycetota bacterium]|jgi:hypothetical protein
MASIVEMFKGGVRATAKDVKRIANRITRPKKDPTKAKKLRSKVKGALPRPPLTAKDLADIAAGQNKEVIRKRRAAINRGIKIRTSHGGEA